MNATSEFNNNITCTFHNQELILQTIQLPVTNWPHLCTLTGHIPESHILGFDLFMFMAQWQGWIEESHSQGKKLQCGVDTTLRGLHCFVFVRRKCCLEQTARISKILQFLVAALNLGIPFCILYALPLSVINGGRVNWLLLYSSLLTEFGHLDLLRGVIA